MRLALFFLISLSLPAIAQDALQNAPSETPQGVTGQAIGTWKVEPGTAQRAATLEYTASETLAYGFSCWKKHWLFFFNYQAPEGGKCESHEQCENDVAEVELTFKIAERPDTPDQFTLFENYYFQDQMLNAFDVAAIVKAKKFSLMLDEKLKAIWQRDSIEFPLDEFEKTVAENKQVFSCSLEVPLPVPPEKQIAAKHVPEKTVASKGKAGKPKVKKSRAARAKAAKSKLPSHALRKKKKTAIKKAVKAPLKKKHR